MRTEFEDLRPGVRYAVYLELRNDSLDPVAVVNQPRVNAELLDSSGQLVAASGASVGGPMPIPQWAVIPRAAYVGFRIDMQTVGVPVREHGTALLAVGGEEWRLRPGRYVLKAAVVFESREGGPSGQWVGTMEPPPVEVALEAQMLAPD
jgi:hypothetical protein